MPCQRGAGSGGLNVGNTEEGDRLPLPDAAQLAGGYVNDGASFGKTGACRGQDRQQTADHAATAQGLPVTALDQDNKTPLAQGQFSTFDNQIDTTTGTVKAKARFANTGSGARLALFPNQFVNVTMLVNTLRATPVVPVSAVRHGAPGDFVFVLKPDKTVKLVVVHTGPSDGSRIAVLSGLRAGQTVVSEGADGLDDGSTVRPPRGGPGGSDAGSGAGPHAGSQGSPNGAADASGQPGQHHHKHPAPGQ